MDSDKTEKPTLHKLRKAREKGEVCKSAELTQTAQFAVFFVLGWLGVDFYLPRLRALFQAWPTLIERTRGAAAAVGHTQLALSALQDALHAWLAAVAPALLAPAAAGLLVAALQVRGVLSIEPLVPKAERLNPADNLKRLFSSRNLIDLAKSGVKVLLIGTAVALTLKLALPQWLRAVSGAAPNAVAQLLGHGLVAIATACLVLYALMAAVDYAHQYFEYMKAQRMSKDEVRREYKDIEGDPYLKGHRRAIGVAMATEEPAAMKRAKVVVTNPTHLSVAIAYDPGAGALPCVVAKGAGAMALAMRREAARLGIPVVENKPLARRLHAQVSAGAFITADSFAEVARVLASVPRTVRARNNDWGRV
jgi:type III secretion protein U